MKIAVIGAGIIGVTTAYELARDGHEVTVFDRRMAAAEETSFANAGIMSPGYASPWAAPGMPLKIIRHLLSRHSPVRFNLPLSANDLGWLWKSLRSSGKVRFTANRARMARLAAYSQARLQHISEELKLEFDRSGGHMVLLRSERDHAMMQAGLQVLSDNGLAFKLMQPAQAREIEPALNPATAFHSALYLPQDEVGNCRQFALLLKNEAQRLGVKFSFSTPVEGLDASSGIALTLAGQPRSQHFDATVMCAGVDSARLLRPLGLKIPLAAVHGYSVSATIRDTQEAPRSAIMDERYKVSISRLGNRVRVAGAAEIGGAPGVKRNNTIQTLYKVLDDWFPRAANWFPGSNNHSSGVLIWKGARPMLPDGPPLVGASGIPGLWFNLGHGASGWALSCGSARALADLVDQREPEIDLEGLDISRLGL